MKYFFSGILLTIFLFSCNNNKSKNNFAYLGGQIIKQPGENNIVVLSKDNVTIDSIKIDGRGKFLYKIKNLKPGLYTFRHEGEVQMVLLEPQDSILLRLNTLEFDESLVFTGNGNKKNNYLIEEFLENERLEKTIFKYCQLPPNIYEYKVDSIKDLKLERLKLFKNSNKTSKLFNNIAQANIKYSYYSAKEIYPFVHYGRDKYKILQSLPKGYYDYRKDVNYNDTLFNTYDYYRTFLRHNINSIALSKHTKQDTSKPFKRSSVCFNLDRLEVTDSLLKNSTIKDDFLFHFAISYVARSHNNEDNTKILSSFLSKSNNDADKTHLKRYVESANKLKVGSTIPNIAIVDYNNAEFKLQNIVNKPTVICFWSQDYFNHFLQSHRKVKELKIKYPEVDFIIINSDKSNPHTIKELLINNHFPLTNEYVFSAPKESSEILAIHPITKAFIIDKRKYIVNGNANIFSVRFEEQLLGAINR
ncbi:MAG: TlpA family protein disulfide reductase [Aestuariibaculum sp.]